MERRVETGKKHPGPRLHRGWSLMLAVAAWPATAQQAGDPAAQELLRQQERERVLREQQEQRPDVRLERDAQKEGDRLPAQEHPCVRIDRIVLEGEDSQRFGWALAAADPADDPATGRCLGTEGINVVMKRVQNAIIARGYVTTRVLSAPQDLNQGTLALSVVPGRFREAVFSDPQGRHPALANALPIRSGGLLNLRDIEQGLENLQRVPTVSADIKIAPADGEARRPARATCRSTGRSVHRYAPASPWTMPAAAGPGSCRPTRRCRWTIRWA